MLTGDKSPRRRPLDIESQLDDYRPGALKSKEVTLCSHRDNISNRFPHIVSTLHFLSEAVVDAMLRTGFAPEEIGKTLLPQTDFSSRWKVPTGNQ
jgi:hypothetical protein